MRLRARQATLATTLALVLPAACAPASAPAAGALTLPPAAPPELLALLARTEALNVETARFSVSSSVQLAAHARIPREIRDLLALLRLKLTGEARSSREEGTFTLTFLGRSFRLVTVPGHTYVDAGAGLGRRDGGRPWVDTGRAGLQALLKAPRRSHVHTAPPAASAPSFKKLAGLLGSPIAATALGPAVVEGQQVQGFRETVSLALFNRTAVASPGIFSARRAAALPETATVETFIAASGLPVRTRILVAEGEVTTIVEIDFPAIDFPLVVQPPPAGEVIGLAALRRLERRRRHR